MSNDTFWRVQTALYSHLTQNSALCALLAAGAGSIYDDVPRDAAFPYIVIGAMQAQPAHTQQHSGYDVTVTLHCYSRGEGQREVKNILFALGQAMQNGDISPAEHHVALCTEISSACAIEADGETRHGRAEYRLTVEPVS